MTHCASWPCRHSRLSSFCPAAVVLGYLHYVTSMINEICSFLRIPCLTVRKVAD